MSRIPDATGKVVIDLKESPTPEDMMGVIEYEHPHIALRIKMLWGLPQCPEYMEGLMLVNRTQRSGFSPPMFMSLRRMIDLHDKHFSRDVPTDVWVLQ